MLSAEWIFLSCSSRRVKHSDNKSRCWLSTAKLKHGSKHMPVMIPSSKMLRTSHVGACFLFGLDWVFQSFWANTFLLSMQTYSTKVKNILSLLHPRIGQPFDIFQRHPKPGNFRNCRSFSLIVMISWKILKGYPPTTLISNASDVRTKNWDITIQNGGYWWAIL